jgi:hypothetical protein
LKGSGWYETDFKSDKEIKRNLADRPEKEESKKDSPDAASTSKAETKAADSTAPKTEAKSAGDSKRTSVAVSKPGKGKRPPRGGPRKAKRRRA